MIQEANEAVPEVWLWLAYMQKRKKKENDPAARIALINEWVKQSTKTVVIF